VTSTAQEDLFAFDVVGPQPTQPPPTAGTAAVGVETPKDPDLEIPTDSLGIDDPGQLDLELSPTTS
jgi:hypothetical protein